MPDLKDYNGEPFTHAFIPGKPNVAIIANIGLVATQDIPNGKFLKPGSERGIFPEDLEKYWLRSLLANLRQCDVFNNRLKSVSNSAVELQAPKSYAFVNTKSRQF